MSSTALPLAGTRVIVTRAARQADTLANALRDAGAEVALLPLLEIVPPSDPLPLEQAQRQLDDYDWLAFTSANAVNHAWPSHGAARVALPRIAVVGPATAAAVRARGGSVALEATRRNGRGLADALLDAHPTATPRILLPQAADARPELADALRRAGARVDVVVAYDKRLPEAAIHVATKLFTHAPIGWVTFASPRTVEHFVAVMGNPARRDELRAAAIGPTTARALRRHGIDPVVAGEPTPAGLVAVIVAAVTS